GRRLRRAAEPHRRGAAAGGDGARGGGARGRGAGGGGAGGAGGGGALRGRVEERQAWEAQALREENQRKDEFLAVLANELRNPLSPLVTGLELIKCYDIEHGGVARVRALG